MHATLAGLLDRIDSPTASTWGALLWSCPVPAFGDPSRSRVATLGINPSNREFVDPNGTELVGDQQRLPTLASLGLESWSDAHSVHLDAIVDACVSYFEMSPYDRWFGVLDGILSGTGASYYESATPACHLDLVPFATGRKWGTLTRDQRIALFDMAAEFLGQLITRSAIEVLILNGRSVVRGFDRITETTWDTVTYDSWTLPRQGNKGVPGFAYTAQVTAVAGVDLGRELCVLGYNHNLQSSFGVTRDVIQSIGNWVEDAVSEKLA